MEKLLPLMCGACKRCRIISHCFKCSHHSLPCEPNFHRKRRLSLIETRAVLKQRLAQLKSEEAWLLTFTNEGAASTDRLGDVVGRPQARETPAMDSQALADLLTRSASCTVAVLRLPACLCFSASLIVLICTETTRRQMRKRSLRATAKEATKAETPA